MGVFTIGGLKLVMDQRLLSVDAHADEAVGAVGFDGGLFGIDDSEDLEVVVLEGEAGRSRGSSCG